MHNYDFRESVYLNVEILDSCVMVQTQGGGNITI